MRYCSLDQQNEDRAWHGWFCKAFAAKHTTKCERAFLIAIDAAVNAPPAPGKASMLCACAVDITLKELHEMRPTLENGGVRVVEASATAPATCARLSACGTSYIFKVVLEIHRALAREYPRMVGHILLTFTRPPADSTPNLLPRLSTAEVRVQEPPTTSARRRARRSRRRCLTSSPDDANGNANANVEMSREYMFEHLVHSNFFANITSRFGRPVAADKEGGAAAAAAVHANVVELQD